jgi:hypothetical protein
MPTTSATAPMPLRLSAELRLDGDAVGNLAIAEGVVFVVRAGALVAIDASHPSPRVLSRLDIGAHTGRIAADGHRLAVSTGGEVVLFDATDPTAIRREASFASGGRTVFGLAQRGDLVVVTDGKHLTTWRRHDGGSMARTGQLGLELGGRITLTGELALVAADCHGMIVVDLHDPARPKKLGSFTGPGDVTGVAVDEARALAFVADYTGGVSVVNLASPRAPRQLADWDEGMVGDVAVDGTHLHVAMGTLTVLDTTDPRKPRMIESHVIEPDVDTAWSVGLDGDRVVALGERGISIWRSS